ncbi:MAG TPA: DUF6544 family protein [Ruminiclostridium sp.]|nr:DUF6544 family protein [Ruminiclostridium sp.]
MKRKNIKKRKALITIISVLIIVCGVVVALLQWDNTLMKRMYLAEVQNELSKSTANKEVFSEEELSSLPAPVQRYFKYCGYIGKEKMANAEIVWDDVNFKMSPDKPWAKIKYNQYNFVSEPARFAYIYTKMFGVIPFEGRDMYRNGQGNMLGRLAEVITLFDQKGKEMDLSAAVTYLSESLIVPSCALQSFIHWESLDANHAKASIKYCGVNAEGIFSFDNDGKLIEFVTTERYMDTGNGEPEKHQWTVSMDSYIKKNGVKIPTKTKAVWNLPGGDYEYFNGTITDIVYNCNQAK